jgi:hypothetical protein
VPTFDFAWRREGVERVDRRTMHDAAAVVLERNPGAVLLSVYDPAAGGDPDQIVGICDACHELILASLQDGDREGDKFYHHRCHPMASA